MRTVIQLVFIISLSFIGSAHAQIRGAVPGELYFFCLWYIDYNNGQVHNGIFRSTDYGKTLNLQYEYIEQRTPDQMEPGMLYGDAQEGTLYNYADNKLWRSFDYGISWEYLEEKVWVSYATGYDPGEIYRRTDYNLYSASQKTIGF